MKRHAANFITLIRILGVGLIFYWVPFKTLYNQQMALILFSLLALTDCIDGWLARSRWGMVTNIGKLLDPMADKLLVLIYLPLIEMHQITSGPVAIILARDIIVTSLRIFAIQQGQVMAAKLSGKIKTAISFPLAAVLLCRPVVDNHLSLPIPILGSFLSWFINLVQRIPQLVITITIWTLVIVTIISLIEYSWGFLAKKEKRQIFFEPGSPTGS